MTMHLLLPQYCHVPSMQAELAMNQWRQRAYEWQARAEWWQAYAQGQAYAHAQWQRWWLATPLSPCNDYRAANVETPISKRKRRASLEVFIARAQSAAQRMGLAVKAVEEKADGSRVAHFGKPLKDNRDMGDAMTNPWDRKVLTDAAD